MTVRLFGTPKTRRVYRCCGLSHPIQYGVHNNNMTNLRRGLLERVFNVETPNGLQPPPRPVPGALDCLEEFVAKIGRIVGPAVPCTTEEFVATYNGDRRQLVYQQAADSLKIVGVTKGDARLSTFVKAEKINFTKKPDPAPRVIQPRSPRYNLEVGKYLKRVEKKIYQALGEIWGGPVVMKGFNGEGTAYQLREKWEKFNDPVAVGLDASRFDQHVSREILEWEHRVYLACFRSADRKELRKLLRWQLENTGIARASDGLIKYTVDGCRMSGDMNTGLGNCLIMCCLVWAYLQHVGIKGDLANNGDDCVVFMERKDVNRFMAELDSWFLDRGFTMTSEKPVSVFEQIEFCQTHPVHVKDRWLMSRDCFNAMAKDCVTVLPLDQGRMRFGWLTAIGECGMALAGGMPIFQEFYYRMVELGKGVHIGRHPFLESGFARLSAGMFRKYQQVEDTTRISFWEAFGVLPSDQIMFEEQLKSMQFDMSSITPRDNHYPHDYQLTQTFYRR